MPYIVPLDADDVCLAKLRPPAPSRYPSVRRVPRGGEFSMRARARARAEEFVELSSSRRWLDDTNGIKFLCNLPMRGKIRALKNVGALPLPYGPVRAPPVFSCLSCSIRRPSRDESDDNDVDSRMTLRNMLTRASQQDSARPSSLVRALLLATPLPSVGSSASFRFSFRGARALARPYKC